MGPNIGQRVATLLAQSGAAVACVDRDAQTAKECSELAAREGVDTLAIAGDVSSAGALHSLDVAVMAPVFVEDELAGWVGNAIHQVDMGAMSPGRAPLAVDAYQEGINIRGLKLVREGVIDQQIFQLFSDNVRMPRYQNMDLRAQISANLAAGAKLESLIEKYGLDAYRESCEISLDLAEQSARERIRNLPDGHYEREEFLDYDHAYRLRATLDVDGDTLRFDLSGTDPQSRTFINSAEPCTVANMHNILACQLFPDLDVNEGTFRAIDITIPPGTLLSAQFPVPTSGASTLAGWKAQQLALGLISQAVMGSDQEFRAQAQWGWAFTEASWSGRDREQRWFSMKGDSTMHGGGARRHADGIDVANIAGSTNTALPSVESYELRYPVLYRSRGIVPDSEGAGEFRGGFAGEWTRVLYGVGEANDLTCCIGRDYGAAGVEGGNPASVVIERGSDVWEKLADHVPSFDELSGESELLPQQPKALHNSLRNVDVIHVTGMGGGGFGVPTERAREAVLSDVAQGLVSPERAASVYGLD
ncbi:hydantoinase B/oxoprolinase family protein [Streptomyces sp. NPDC046900]|uniref:hydantoinase B/oxoprolinase family protein n=1 Tax=Streptomyces sp. NPDC046900 TaxID=3155473 RepID=UPI0033D2D917